MFFLLVEFRMLARDQNLLLQPEVNPSVGLRYLSRSVQLANAWSKQGGTATLVHDDLPARLARQLKRLSIELLPLSNVDHFAASTKSGWLLMDGTSGQPAVECVDTAGADSVKRWKLAATRTWAEANITRFQCPDLLVSLETDDLSSSLLRADRILHGSRYQLPKLEGSLLDFQSEAATVPGVARKILVWLSEEDSGSELAEMLSDVIDVAEERTSVDVVANVKQRDSSALVQLKKANPQVIIRYWSSIERRLQSMAPIHLAIVDQEMKSQALAVRQIPVVCINGTDRFPVVFEPANSSTKKFSLDAKVRVVLRRSLSRLIRSRDHRRKLIDSSSSNQNQQAADRIARSLATADMLLESARLEDWSEVARWQSDPESLASALPRSNRDIAAGRNEFAAALNRTSITRWMLRQTCGTRIGMASLDPCEPTMNGIVRLQVLIKPTIRNQGYGTTLLERVLEQVLGYGDVRQVIVQARPTDQAARRMAWKAGLQPVASAVVNGVVAHQFSIDANVKTSLPSERIPLQRSA